MSIIKKILEERAAENLVELDEAAESALAKKAEKSGISLSTLKTVYKRGVAAWNSGHRPGTTPQQWGMARVNSYITKGKGTYHGADKDLREDLEDIDEAESWEAGYKRRVVKTTDPEHKEKGYNWRIKGKERPEISIKLYKEKPSQDEFNKQMRRVAGHEFGEEVEVMEDSRIDNKAYHKGVSDSTAKARVAHWKKMDKLSDRDPRAYEPAPGDATAKTKESKHTKKYRELYGEEAVYLEDLDEQIEMLDEMPGANMDTRAVHQHLKKSGWSLTRTSGGHDIYTHPEAKHSIPVPRHRQLKAPLVLGILKSSKLRKEEKEVDELDTSDYKVDKTGRKYKAHKLVFNKGEEDMKEELKGNQHKLDVDKDGKIEGEDLAKLRKMKKEETELDEAVNAEKIKKDLDSGMSVDAVIGKHANKKLTNTGEIRKVIQQHMWNKRMKKEETELDERELSDAEMKERERIVKGLKKSYKDFASRYGSRAKSVMYATATKLAKEEFSEDILEELEQIQELSKSTLASYVKKASRNIGTRRALATTFDRNADSARNPATKEMNRKIAGDFTMDARKRVQGVDKAVERLAKEETEQIDELSKQLVARAYKKASERSDLDIDDDMGEKAGKQADKFKARLSQHSPKNEVPGRGTGSSKYGDDLNFPYRADAKETKKDGTLSKKAVHTSKYVAGMKLSGLKNQPKPNLPEEFELAEEIKPYVSGGHAEGWSVLDHKGKEVKKFHWKDYMDHPVKDKRKEAYNDAVSYLRKHYNSLRKPTNECIEEHLLDLCEAMIERDDFDDRVAAYKKSGFKVLDAKHSDMKAHISFVDGEGMHRTVKYTPTGKTMQNHGPYGGGEKDESGEKVNKSEVKTVKRGRGRPRKDKFAESVDILLSLTEEEFDEIMEGSSLDEIVESLCNLSEEELKELKGE